MTNERVGDFDGLLTEEKLILAMLLQLDRDDQEATLFALVVVLATELGVSPVSLALKYAAKAAEYEAGNGIDDHSENARQN